MLGRLSEEYPPDLELSQDERKRYQEIINFPDYWGVAFVYEQSCLLRNRIKSLNTSSKRIEIATYILLVVTIVLLLTTILSSYLM